MKAAIVLFILAATSINGLDSTPTNPLIIGGSLAPVGFAPYLASLKNFLHVHICAASILNDRWFLTAAQCINSSKPNLYAAVGTTYVDCRPTIYTFKVIVSHSGFNRNTFQNDIAMLKTWGPIVFTDLIKPINLPGNDVSVGQNLTITGWGRTMGSSTVLSIDLLYTNVIVLSDNDCKSRFTASELQGKKIDSTNLCTHKLGTGSCVGDVGGPLVSNGVQYAIVSWNMDAKGIACNTNYPDVSTRLSQFGSWIWWTQHNNKWA